MALKLTAKVAGLDSIAAELQATPEAIKTASRRAITRATKWANTQISRRVSKITSVQGKVIGGRVRISIRDDSGLIFVGLSPISARRLSPKQDSKGVSFSGKYVPGAFIIRGGGKLAGQVMIRKDGKRLPIVKQTLPIYDAAAPEVEAVYAEAKQLFTDEFTRQLRLLAKLQ